MSLIVKRNNGINRIQSVSWSSNNHKSIDGYQLLAIEIIRVAAEDYRRELIKSKKEKLKTRECYRLERFFLSEYGQLLSMGKGEYIIEQIRKEVKNARE
jgi:hypothetical protein